MIDKALAALQELVGEIKLEDLQIQFDTLTGNGDIDSDDMHNIIDEIVCYSRA
jgi:hypothetical protein